MTSDHAGYVPNELLSRLVGFRLYSVEFVSDYVQLRFDGPTEDRPVLNCDVLPVVEIPAGRIDAAQVGWADALRALINEVVVGTVEETGRGLRVEFDHAVLSIHPDISDIEGPEIALLDGFTDRQWMCWRPGELSFEDVR
jgi:hypothetical protein